MIALATPQPTAPPIGQLITIYESAEAGLMLHWTGRLVGIDHEPNGESYWLLVDDTGNRLSIPWSDIRQKRVPRLSQPIAMALTTPTGV
jgi:hypothetical protein